MAGGPLCANSHPIQSKPLFSLQNTRPGARKNSPGKWGNGDTPESEPDYVSKLLHLAWHPEVNVIAAAASNSLYMYCA